MKEIIMEEFLVGVLVGVIGCKVASRSTGQCVDLYMRLTGWFNCRRFNRLQVKATAAGFGSLFAEEWRATGIEDPRHQRGMEAERAFHPTKEGNQPMRFLDQFDADSEAHRWVNERAIGLSANRIEWFNHEDGCGRTGAVWNGNGLVALAVVVRDTLNHSVLTCHEIQPVASNTKENSLEGTRHG